MTKPEKILIVEDDPDTATMLSAYFEAQGYKALTVSWGNDALKLVQENVPDLIIQDIRLPDMDGYQVVSELRKNTRTSHTPIIFLTERKGQDDKIAALELGAVDYITKPFDMQELSLRVRNALRRASYASLVNPVTGLPDQQVTESRLQEWLDQGHWAVILVSIAGLEAFSEAYGFVAGDDVLRAISLIISNVVDDAGTREDLIGHADRASFVLLTQEDKAQDIRERLASRLEKAFPYFYPVQAVESGQNPAPMRAQVGVVLASSGRYDSPRAVLDAAMRARRTLVATPRPNR
jgi:PleD family two-component response regulator